MNNERIRRIFCIITGGCKFKGGAECHIDNNDMVTITETCCKCGKKFSFTAPYRNFGGERLNDNRKSKRRIKQTYTEQSRL